MTKKKSVQTTGEEIDAIGQDVFFLPSPFSISFNCLKNEIPEERREKKNILCIRINSILGNPPE
jgi:hypothetical protein